MKNALEQRIENAFDHLLMGNVNHDLFSAREVGDILGKIKETILHIVEEEQVVKIPREQVVEILQTASEVHIDLVNSVGRYIEKTVDTFDYSEYIELELDGNELQTEFTQRGVDELTCELNEAMDEDDVDFIGECLSKLGYETQK